jgi:hypothetical protein
MHTTTPIRTKSQFILLSQGYESCPTFATLREARDELNLMIRDAKRAIRARYKCGAHVKRSGDSVEILIGRNGFHRWGFHSIQKLNP